MDKNMKIAAELTKLARELTGASDKFKVEVQRQSWANHEFTVEGSNRREAEKNAIREAEGYSGWSEKGADYSVEGVKTARELVSKPTRRWKRGELEKMLLEVISPRWYKGVKTDKVILGILDKDYGGAPDKRQYEEVINGLHDSGHITKTNKGWKR